MGRASRVAAAIWSGDAIADQRFKHFYEAYGGLPVFGYPISDLLTRARPGQRAAADLCNTSSARVSS